MDSTGIHLFTQVSVIKLATQKEHSKQLFYSQNQFLAACIYAVHQNVDSFESELFIARSMIHFVCYH